jgi:hypothetical protein
MSAAVAPPAAQQAAAAGSSGAATVAGGHPLSLFPEGAVPPSSPLLCALCSRASGDGGAQFVMRDPVVACAAGHRCGAACACAAASAWVCRVQPLD